MTWRRMRYLYYRYRAKRRDLPAAIRNSLNIGTTLDLMAPIAETHFVAFDTETTGLSAKTGDRIISLSAVRVRGCRIDLSDCFHSLVNPNRDIPSKSSAIHEILTRMVVGKPTLEEVLPNFLEYIGDCILVGHHAWLDLGFLNREMVRLYGFPIQNRVLDTVVLDRTLISVQTNPSLWAKAEVDSSLTAVAGRYQVSVEERHSSFGDALATGQILVHLIKRLQRCGITTVGDLFRAASEYDVSGHCAQQISYC